MKKITINNLYVIAKICDGPNATNDELVSDEVYMSKEEAEKMIDDPKLKEAITLKDWGDEKYDSGYVYAYG